MNVSSTTGNMVMYTDTYTISQLTTTDDGREYQCEVVIDTSPPVIANNTVTLDVTVPTPSVTVTAPNTQTVGQSLTLECNVTAVRGIEVMVNIIWSVNGGILETMEGVNVSSTTDNSVVYTDTYTVAELSTDDDGREYQCEVVINTSPPVMANDTVTLDVMVPAFGLAISPNGVIRSGRVGDQLNLYCVVTTDVHCSIPLLDPP
ncbi:uncharacterized protein [Dysidea avara]|uniref:uncharacterized protein n=1 Tax=Dysidea avara TaxID=196820 RepID=UPI00331A2CE1